MMFDNFDGRARLIPDSQPQYDPFMNPPSLILAQKHKLAMSVGTQQITIGQPIERCPCCHHSIHKNSLPVCIPDEQLSFLGAGHPLYYCLSKYFAFLILLVFVSSGGFFYFFQNLRCKTECANFFGIPIMSIQELDSNPELKTQWFNLSTCILVMIGVLCIKPRIKKQIQNFKSRMWCASNYTIMLQNLPPISQEELNRWLKNFTGVQPVKINLSYDLTPFQEAYRRKQDLVFRINKLKIQSQSVQVAIPYNKTRAEQIDTKIELENQKLEKQNKILRQFNTPAFPPIQTGTAFATFNQIKTCQTFIKEWGDSFTRSFMNCCFGFIHSPYPVCHSRYVLVSMAPSPADIIWQNLSFSFIRNIFFEILALLLMSLIILLAFKLQYQFVNLAFKLKQQRQKTGEYLIIFQSISMSGIILVLNMLLRLVVTFILNKDSTVLSYAKILFLYKIPQLIREQLSYDVFSEHMLYCVYCSRQQILIWDIHLIMFTNAFSEPFAKLIDPTIFIRFFSRWWIRRSPRNPYTQKYVNSIWQGHPMSIADNYQYIARVLLITVWFSYAAPLGVVFSLLAMLLNYWVDKIYLTKVNKLPEPVNQTVAYKILMALQLLPLVYMCGTLQYTYKFGESTNIIDFLAKFFNYGVVFMVILLTMLGYALFQRRQFTEPHQQITYQEAQYLLTCDYDSQNPITRYQSQILFLNKLLKSKNLGESSSLKIQTMINKLEKKRSIEQLELTRSQIMDIKTQLASQRLQWHKYSNSQPEQMLSLTKNNSVQKLNGNISIKQH